MADPQTFTDVVAATARQKLAAAKARSNPDGSAEKPRDAIFDALRMVGEAIADQGFSFTPSDPKFSRRHGDFTFEIRIQSDRNNVAGQRAAIWVHVGIYSKSLTSWRKKHCSDWIRPKASFPLPLYGNQLGYLCNPSGWMEWDFADNAKRHSVVDDLLACIRNGAFPLFAIFDGSPADIAAIGDQDWPPPQGVLAYLLSIGQESLANETLQAYLDKRPDFRSDFKQFYHQFSEQGLPPYAGSIPHALAAFSVATGLVLNGN
jgi:hypothetical protein